MEAFDGKSKQLRIIKPRLCKTIAIQNKVLRFARKFCKRPKDKTKCCSYPFFVFYQNEKITEKETLFKA